MIISGRIPMSGPINRAENFSIPTGQAGAAMSPLLRITLKDFSRMRMLWQGRIQERKNIIVPTVFSANGVPRPDAAPVKGG